MLFLICNSLSVFSQESILKFEHITSSDGLPQNTILGIVKDKYGFMWFGTWDGLCRYDGYTFKTYIYNSNDKKSINSNRIQNIKLDKNKNLWVRTFENEELCRYNYEHNNFDRFAKSALHDSLFDWTDRRKHVESIQLKHKQLSWKIDIQKNRLVETNTKTGKTKVYENNSQNPGALNDSYVTDIYKDDHNILWIGTYSNGINKANLNAKPFQHIYHDSSIAQSLIDKNVTAICEDKQGNIWVGTRDQGISVIGNKTRHIQKGVNSINSNLIRSIFCDSRGIIWIGTKDGLNSYNPATNVFRNFSKELDSKSTFGIIEDREHNLLFATWNGVYKYNFKENRLISYDVAKMQLHPFTRVIMQDSKGRIWVGCEGGGGNTGGISVLEPVKNKEGFKVKNHFIHNENKNSISNNRINCLYEDKKGFIWIGTGNGLDKYDPKNNRFTNLSVNNQFPKSSVVAILEDNNGYLWISHKKGISQLDTKTLKIRTYTLLDGLQSKEFTAGSAFKSKNQNKLYFGGNNGVNFFDPDSILPEKTLSNTVLTELEILNRRVGINEKLNGRIVLTKPLYLTKEIQLKHGDKSISIEFAALHYSNPQANKYAYKLEGFNKDWVYTDANKRFATYSNLEAGNYVFKVISSNSDGIWNTKPAVLNIEVLPPFWASSWAYVLYTILVLIGLYIYHQYTTRITLLKSKLAYEALLHEQENELYQNKLQFFTNISHEIKTPLTLILAPLERLLGMFPENKSVQNQLSTMKVSGDRLYKLVNQLLDFRKLETAHLDLNLQKQDIIAFLSHTLQSFQDAADKQDITLSFVHNVSSCSFSYDEDKLEKVVYNLLSNALKFTPNYGWIKIQFSFAVINDEQFSVIEVINSAKEAIPEDDLKVIFLPFRQGKNNNSGGTGLGLAFSKGLVELHGGSLSASSLQLNKNEYQTSFKISLPLNQSQQNITQREISTAKKENPNFENTEQLVKGKSQTILIVEDNVDMRRYLKDFFSEFYTVLEAANGKEGLETTLNHLPDLIISDVMMDEMDGFEFCRRIKTDLKTASIPVVLLTAKTPVEDEIHGIETGADDYITKPFNLSLLAARVKNLLVSRNALKERYRKEISLKPNENIPVSADEKMLQKLLRFVEENIENSGLGVEEICNAVGVSRTQLYKKIKDLKGLSISEIIKEIRLKKAKQLLSSDKFTINEIAAMVGFSDADYFRKCFKSEFSMTPTEYAKSVLSNKENE